MGQFQPNLAQSILGWREFQIIQINGHALHQEEIITEKRKYIEEIFKIFLSRTIGPVSTQLAIKHPW